MVAENGGAEPLRTWYACCPIPVGAFDNIGGSCHDKSGQQVSLDKVTLFQLLSSTIPDFEAN